jgi:hypothetical protein
MALSIGVQPTELVGAVDGDPIVGRFDAAAALDGLTELRRAMRALPLERSVATSTRRELDGIQIELTKSDPDCRRAAARLERLTRVLATAGVLVAAGATLGPPITDLAERLGPLGDPVLQVLHR